MTIEEYLSEMEYALVRVIEALWHEHAQAEALSAEIADLCAKARDGYTRGDFIRQNSEDPDDFMFGVGIHWDTYFSEDKEQFYKSKELDALNERLCMKEFSFASLAGNLLQYAKQGLSAAYGPPKNWPLGRLIGRQPLKIVILQARNQAEHWEEGAPNKPVTDCFDQLVSEVGVQFAAYKTKNLAFEVVSHLGWRSLGEFAADLRGMKPEGGV